MLTNLLFYGILNAKRQETFKLKERGNQPTVDKNAMRIKEKKERTKKEGTPTMGGLAFIVASAVAFTLVLLIFWQEIEKREMALLVNIFAYGILNSLVGIIDDSSKLRKNEKECFL